MVNDSLVGIMVSQKRRRKRCLKKYLPHNDFNLILFSFTPDCINWKEKTIYGLYCVNDQWIETQFPFPVAVYNRCYRNTKKIINRLEMYIGKNKCFNCQNQLNKWEVYKILHQSETELKHYLPYTNTYEPITLLSTLDRYKSLFIKPCRGHMGKHTYRVELGKIGQIYIYQDYRSTPMYSFTDTNLFLDKVNELTSKKTYIIQQEVPICNVSGRLFDIRVMVQKNVEGEWGMSSICSRMAFHYLYNTSFYEHVLTEEEFFNEVVDRIKIVDTDLRDTLEKISVKTADILERNLGLLGELGVDFGIDEDGALWIIEVNGKPQKVLFDDQSDPTIRDLVYKKPLEFAYYLTTVIKDEKR